MTRCTLVLTFGITLALAFCAQPVIAASHSTTLSGGLEFYNSIEASDGIGQISYNSDNGALYLGGDEPVTIFMKIDIPGPVITASFVTGGDIASNTVGTGAGGYFAVGTGLVDPLDPSLGLINEHVIYTREGGGDWDDLNVDITTDVAGSSEIWVAMHANQDGWRNYGTRVYGYSPGHVNNGTLTVSGDYDTNVYTLGDANFDTYVDYQDATILASNWQVQTGATWWMGDFNYDEKVDDEDATIMAVCWNPPPGVSVPEPGTLTLLALGLISLLVIRRR